MLKPKQYGLCDVCFVFSSHQPKMVMFSEVLLSRDRGEKKCRLGMWTLKNETSLKGNGTEWTAHREFNSF